MIITPEITKDVLEQVKFVLKAKEVFIVSKYDMDIAPMPLQWLVVRFKWKKTRSRRIPEWMDRQQLKEWFYRTVEELYPKKPRPGAARRKTQPSIKSKVLKSFSEVALFDHEAWGYLPCMPR